MCGGQISESRPRWCVLAGVRTTGPFSCCERANGLVTSRVGAAGRSRAPVVGGMWQAFTRVLRFGRLKSRRVHLDLLLPIDGREAAERKHRPGDALQRL